MTHLPQRGLPLEEVCVLAALRRVELGVEESAAIGDGLQGGGTLVGEGETHKQLWRRKTNTRLFLGSNEKNKEGGDIGGGER